MSVVMSTKCSLPLLRATRRGQRPATARLQHEREQPLDGTGIGSFIDWVPDSPAQRFDRNWLARQPRLVITPASL